jgi:hypothetical protein
MRFYHTYTEDVGSRFSRNVGNGLYLTPLGSSLHRHTAMRIAQLTIPLATQLLRYVTCSMSIPTVAVPLTYTLIQPLFHQMELCALQGVCVQN